MNIKEIISDNLPEGASLTDAQINDIAKAIQAEQGKNYVPNAAYKEKVSRIDELETELANAKAVSVDAKSYKEKLEAEQKAHEETRALYKQKAKDADISAYLSKSLKERGANEKYISLLLKGIDKSKAKTAEGDGGALEISNIDELIEPVQKEYADAFGKVNTQGARVQTPPSNFTAGSLSLEDIQGMSAEEINKNWDKVQKTLNKK